MRRTPAPPPGRLIDAPPFPQGAAEALKNQQLRDNMRHATHTIRAKRARVTAELPNWEELRAAGEAIKNRTLENLDYYLEQLEANLIKNGAQVHWASDAQEAQRIVIDLIKAKGENMTHQPTPQEVVKVKSMVTQEIELNEALEAEGIAAWETDLAELIVQLGHDRPSNILVPAIHRNRDEVREIFLREMKLYGKPAPEDLDNDPKNLAAAARLHLREKFLRAKIALSGVNFCVAESGTLVIVESEGNGRMCLTLPETLISITGIEKLVPTAQDLEVMLQLLPRSSTGERMNPYTSMWTGVTPGDGPQEVHVVLVDNGRSRVLADPVGREALRCIRCAACMHQCPVYEKVGGHPYGSVYPGPIGSVLTPQLRGLDSAIDKSLPYASTLCGACAEVCPVKIPIPDILVHLRQRVVDEKKRGHRGLEQSLMRLGGWVMAKGSRLGLAGAAAGLARALIRKEYLRSLPGLGKRWTAARDLRMPPRRNFRHWWKHERGGQA
ncbi:MAG: LutB/LldF family L-lactate oxidation iron-sulfur protein [Coriobacteriia bacterium]|nr:LutB/LldF family L-lactate oxidation iron-sulfur protein [Coriobacteriia bacterium]